jgi:hypothetical protein
LSIRSLPIPPTPNTDGPIPVNTIPRAIIGIIQNGKLCKIAFFCAVKELKFPNIKLLKNPKIISGQVIHRNVIWWCG